jgi:hypothetical protein
MAFGFLFIFDMGFFLYFLNTIFHAPLVTAAGAAIRRPATFGQSVGRVVEIHLEDEITVAAALV